MSSISLHPMDRSRRSEGRVRASDYDWRAVMSTAFTSPGFAGCVGRVGALAVALGVGSAIAAIPVALAETTGSAESSASDSAVKAPGRPAVRVARSGGAVVAKSPAAAAGSVTPRAAAVGVVAAQRGSVVAWLGWFGRLVRQRRQRRCGAAEEGMSPRKTPQVRVYSAEMERVSESLVDRWRTNNAPNSAFRTQGQFE